ncbi:TPA: hypothetical protein ACHSXF_001294, partial [Pseudomonas aeruginosa]
ADGAQSAALIAAVATPEKATPRVAFFVSTIERADAAGQRPAEGNMGESGKAPGRCGSQKRKKGPKALFSSTQAETWIMFGAGNESCTRALSLCFPITFSTVVISEELNYSLVFRPRQQSSSNHFHQRPRMIHPPVVTPDASSC